MKLPRKKHMNCAKAIQICSRLKVLQWFITIFGRLNWIKNKYTMPESIEYIHIFIPPLHLNSVLVCSKWNFFRNNYSDLHIKFGWKYKPMYSAWPQNKFQANRQAEIDDNTNDEKSIEFWENGNKYYFQSETFGKVMTHKFPFDIS